jgi:hypothetical protein
MRAKSGRLIDYPTIDDLFAKLKAVFTITASVLDELDKWPADRVSGSSVDAIKVCMLPVYHHITNFSVCYTRVAIE